MERVYFSINESAARTAHSMMSFSDYKEGSKTAGYKAQVDKAYELGEKVIQARPSEEERVTKLCERYSRRLAQNINKDIQIGMMCPSVMISGAGNFPVKKKEKQVAAWDKNHEDYKQVEGILHKIESIFYGKDVIKSSDENAIEKLQEKVDELRETQEHMKEPVPFLSRLRSQLRPLLSYIAGRNRPCPNPYLRSTVLLSQLPLLSPLAVLPLQLPAYTSSLPLPLWLCRPAGFFLSPARAFLKCH